MLRGALDLYAALRNAEPALAATVDDDALAELDQHLPAALVEGCIERRLAEPSAAADLWTTIPFDLGGRETVQRFLRSAPQPREAGWSGFYALLQEWSQPGSKLSAHSTDLFLEWDAPSPPVKHPITVVGLQSPLQPRDLRPLISKMLNAALTPGINEAASRALENVSARPATLNALRNVATINTRATPSIRLGFWVAAHAAGDFLSSLGCARSAAGVDELCRVVASRVRLVGLLIDPQQPDRPAVEFALPRNASADEQFGTLLQRLEGLGICRPEATAEVQDWIARTRSRSDLHRHLIIKATFGAGELLGAKAYFGFSPVTGERSGR